MQIVKKYTDIVGDRRIGIESKTAVEQINQDLVDNRRWKIHSLIISDNDFYVVYNIDEKRLLTEDYRQVVDDMTIPHGTDNSITSKSNSSLIQPKE